GHGPIDEGEVGGVEGAVGALDGQQGPAGEDVLRERLAQQLVAAHAVAAGRQEGDVVVHGPGVPARRDQRQGRADNHPGGADEPGVRRDEATELREHGSLSWGKGTQGARNWAGERTASIIGERGMWAGKKMTVAPVGAGKRGSFPRERRRAAWYTT